MSTKRAMTTASQDMEIVLCRMPQCEWPQTIGILDTVVSTCNYHYALSRIGVWHRDTGVSRRTARRISKERQKKLYLDPTEHWEKLFMEYVNHVTYTRSAPLCVMATEEAKGYKARCKAKKRKRKVEPDEQYTEEEEELTEEDQESAMKEREHTEAPQSKEETSWIKSYREEKTPWIKPYREGEKSIAQVYAELMVKKETIGMLPPGGMAYFAALPCLPYRVPVVLDDSDPLGELGSLIDFTY